ncbi:hypothetical protein RISK_006501 [Rhodopirellula islandica]|uniref:Uncharacterized protein n=1 Tax=Rhodopirellula islandica TaxID=595434 RepID=A0A0J1B367_RHOIS|nr:hypothetical protein RISK_006501 [Rhodopirellula islandica]
MIKQTKAARVRLATLPPRRKVDDSIDSRLRSFDQSTKQSIG